MNLVIIDYGAGNVQSVRYALDRLGVASTLSNDAETIQKADKIIFPGVGHAEQSMNEIKRLGLDIVIPSLKQPVFGICVGQQVLCDFSEEGNVECLGIINETVKRFAPIDKIPHMGWNTAPRFGKNEDHPLLEGVKSTDQFYFVHSYYVPVNEYTIATCNYINEYSAAMQKDNFYSCQFHPEKSGKVGELVLSNFLNLS